MGQPVVDGGGGEEAVGACSHGVEEIALAPCVEVHVVVVGLYNSHVDAAGVHVGNDLLRCRLHSGHECGASLEPASLAMFLPVVTAMPSHGEVDVLIGVGNELGVGVAGYHPAPEVGYALLKLGDVSGGVGARVRAGLIGEYVDMVVDDHLPPPRCGLVKQCRTKFPPHPPQRVFHPRPIPTREREPTSYFALRDERFAKGPTERGSGSGARVPGL